MSNEKGLNKYARNYLVSIDSDGFEYLSLDKQGDVFPEITIGEAVKRLNSLSESHDKLTEQVKLLREVVSHEYMNHILDLAICGIATNSSSGSVGREERMQKFAEFSNALKIALEATK